MGDKAATGAGAGLLIGGALGPVGFLAGAAIGGMLGAGADMMSDMGPEVPEVSKPEPVVDAGDEGIRRGTVTREAMRRKKAAGQAFLTKGQDRDTGATLGGMAQTLG